MKILFINAYSAKNRGDYAIVISMHDYLKKIYPSCNINIMSSYHDENKKIYSEIDLNSVENIWNMSNKKTILKYFDGLKFFFLALFFPNNKIFDEIRSSDLICSVGGGYLYSSAKGPLGVGFLNMLFHMWLSKRFKKKIISFPQSVGPIKYKLDEIILKKVLKNIDLFISREGITTKYLKEKLLLKNVIEFPDIAFFLDPSSPYEIEMDKEIINIGITVLDWRFADKSATKKDLEQYLQKIVNCLKKIENNIKVYIFVQVDVTESDSDYKISKELEKLLHNNLIKSEVIRFDQYADPRKIISTYGLTNIFIGSRMHSAIFSLNTLTPTIGLSYQPKTFGTFKLIGIKDYAIDIKNFKETELHNLLTKTFQKKYNLQKLEEIREYSNLKYEITKVLE